MVPLQKVRHPIKIEPPDRINQEFASDEGPRLAVRSQVKPLHPRRRDSGITANICQLGLRHTWVIFWLAIQQQPKRQPKKTHAAGDDESPPPSPMDDYPRNQQGRQHRANIRASVKNSYGKESLPIRKPFSDSFNAAGKHSGFSKA